MWRLTEYLIVVGSILLGAAALFFIVFFLYKFIINQRLKGKFIKLHLPRISSIIIAFVILTTGGIGGFFLNELRIINNHKLYAEIGLLRAENAQYVPDITKLSKSFSATASEIQNTNHGLMQASSMREELPDGELEPHWYAHFPQMNTEITLDNYNSLIETIGSIDNAYDSEFTVLDIKEEVKTVFVNVPVFDKWVSLNDGELSGQGCYKLSYNESSGRVTVMRKSSFQPWIWNREKNEGVWNGSFPEYHLLPGQKGYTPNFAPILLDIIYKIDYYFDNGVEVVECEVFTVLHNFGVDNVISYQYIKNVKDTSFTKYIITPRELLTIYNAESESNPQGYDLDSNNPYGTTRRFIQMDYSGASDISILDICQEFTSAYNDKPNLTSINVYANNGSTLTLYNTMFSNDFSFYADLRYSDHHVFYDSYYNDFVTMFAMQSDSSRLFARQVKGFNSDYKNSYGNVITGHASEIIYKEQTHITAYNNFQGDSISGASKNLEKLMVAYDYLEQSLISLAKNTATMSFNGLPAPSRVIRNDSNYENSIHELLEQITIKAINNSYFAKNYKTIIKDASKYVLI